MKYAEHIVDLVGDTPLVKLNSVTEGIAATVLAKVEYLNPGGSVKDRIAVRMVEAAEAAGELQPGGTIVEPTSGNTGVGLAMVAQRKGYTCVFVCPDKVSEDKRNVLKAYGAEVVVCPTAVAAGAPRLLLLDVRPAGARDRPAPGSPTSTPTPTTRCSHYETTGPEIWARDRRPDHPLRRRRRHRRHDHAAPGATSRRSQPTGGAGAGHRRRPGGLGLLRRHRPPLPRRGRRRGLLARRLRPGVRSTRSSRSPTPTPSR